MSFIQHQESQVNVNVVSFNDLFNKTKYPLAIDSYQRGFVWNKNKIDQLQEDLIEFHKQDRNKTPDYYMGTILIHENTEKNKHFVIDGQQRLSALCVLHNCLTGKLPPNCGLSYSPESARNLRIASQQFAGADRSLDVSIFSQIHFTVIFVPTVDLAFTFFDTQNNRGVPLHATDLLKAYHLRAIDGDSRERLQTESAKRWEQLQHGRQVLGHGEDFAPTLFSRFLWRSRTWSGQNNLYFEHHDALMSEFQNQTEKTFGSSESVPIYRSRGNLLGSSLSLHESGAFHLIPRPIMLGSNPAELPFALRQPISRGLGFFLYADKYASLIRELLDEEHGHAEVRAFGRFYRQMIGPLSVYLREAFLLASFMYVDQFGYERLLEFALWLDYSIGSVRIEKAYVKMESAKNYFSERNVNLLDVIAGAFTPRQVLEQLMADTEAERIYREESVKTGEGVQGRYKAAVFAYYQQEEKITTLSGRNKWITESLIKDRILEAMG